MSIEDLISEAFNENTEAINDNTVIMELQEWDSMAHMLFITKFEDTFNIQLTGDEIAHMQSVKDIKKIMEAKGVSA